MNLTVIGLTVLWFRFKPSYDSFGFYDYSQIKSQIHTYSIISNKLQNRYVLPAGKQKFFAKTTLLLHSPLEKI